MGLNILLGNAAARTRALDLAEIDVVFARHLAHQGRQRTGLFEDRGGG